MLVNLSPAPDGSWEPYPDIIVQTVGFSFGLGVVGGSVTQFARGLYNTPRGGHLVGTVQTVGMRAPRIGGSFAVWGGLFAAASYNMLHVRQKEDPCGNIVVGAVVGGIRTCVGDQEPLLNLIKLYIINEFPRVIARLVPQI